MHETTFTRIADAWDTAVDELAQPRRFDPLCSRSEWLLPVAEAFAADATQQVFSNGASHVTLLQHPTPNGPVLTGFDTVWGFGVSVVSPEPDHGVAALGKVLQQLDWYALSVPGIPVESPMLESMLDLEPVAVRDSADRCVADLSDGFDAWLGRRSNRFRRSLRAAVNRAGRAGLVVEPMTGSADAVMQRVLAIEQHSWKTEASSGLVGTSLGRFTHEMARRFDERDGLHALVARVEGDDVGYVIGGVSGSRYRGFQHSFDRDRPDLSIGKVLQFHNLERMADLGIADYDMGMHMSYKESYTDRIESTITLIYANRGR